MRLGSNSTLVNSAVLTGSRVLRLHLGDSLRPAVESLAAKIRQPCAVQYDFRIYCHVCNREMRLHTATMHSPVCAARRFSKYRARRLCVTRRHRTRLFSQPSLSGPHRKPLHGEPSHSFNGAAYYRSTSSMAERMKCNRFTYFSPDQIPRAILDASEIRASVNNARTLRSGSG